MTKGDLVNILLKKFDVMSKTSSELLISIFRYLNPQLETVIRNKYELVCYLADKWYANNITKEVIEAKWNIFYADYNDVDGVFNEDEDGYLL